MARPALGWSEQAPGDWIAAAESVLGQLSAYCLVHLRGIGPSVQMHGATFWDAADNVLRGGTLWNDTRTHNEAGTLDALEGVTFALRDCCDALAAIGAKIDRLLAIGGGYRSDDWPGCIATSLDFAVALPLVGDFGGAFGEARLGPMVVTGAGAEIATRLKIARTLAPVAGL
jgi:xylulokinase